MVDWLYFVHSNSEYHDLMSFLLDGKDFSGISYYVFSEVVESEDGRAFHTSSGYLLAVNFLSHATNLEAKLERVGLDSKSLVDLYKIVCEDDDNPLTRVLTITEGSEFFIFDKKLEKFVVDKHFRFSDGSALSIPLICRKHRL